MRACPRCRLLLDDGASVCAQDGERGEEVELVAPPAEVASRYAELRPFAHGATGTSYRAVHAQSRASGILKILRESSVPERGRLKRELRKQSKLVNNSLVRILDGGEVGTTLWLLRDFAAGESLAARIRRDGRIELSEALAIVAQVASALDELHRAGLLHRDVKPSHVILESRPDAVPLARLIDSGIAARIPTGGALEPLGTAAYVAPEQVDGKLVSFRSDLYSLGCVLHEMLTGAPPFSGSLDEVLRAHRETNPPPVGGSVPAQVTSLLGALLAKEPRTRPFSAQQVRRTLEPLLPSTTPPAHSATHTSAGEVSAPSVTGPASSVPSPFAVEQKTEHLDTAELARHSLGSVPAPRKSVPPPIPGSSAPPPRKSVPPPIPVEARASAPEPAGGVGFGASPAQTDAVTVVMRAPELVDAITAAAAPAGATDEERPLTGEFEIDETSDAAPAPASGAPARPSVNFDVESLFDDGGAPVAGAPDEAAPAASGTRSEETQETEDTDRPAAAAGRFPKVAVVVAAFVAIVAVVALGLPGGEPSESSAPVESAPAASAPDEAPTGAAARAKPADDVPPARPAGGGSEQAEAPAGAENDEAPAEAPAEEATAEAKADDEAEAEVEVAAKAPSDEALPSEAAPEDPRPAASRSTGPAVTAGSARGTPTDRKAKAEALKAEAREHYQAGRYAQAAQAYEQAARQMPSDAGAYAGLGAALLAQGDPDGAIQAYQRAATISPKSSGFYAALGRAYEQKKDLDRARAAYRKAVELSPNNLAASRGLARVGGGE